MYSKDNEEMLRNEAAERAEMDFVSAELRGKEIGKAERKKMQALETAKTLLDMGLSFAHIFDLTTG